MKTRETIEVVKITCNTCGGTAVEHASITVNGREFQFCETCVLTMSRKIGFQGRGHFLNQELIKKSQIDWSSYPSGLGKPYHWTP